MSLALYLCSEHAELRDPRDPDRRPRRPQPTRTKRGLREFAASRVTTWEVAYRLGAALEQAQANVGGEGRYACESASPCAPRPLAYLLGWAGSPAAGGALATADSGGGGEFG